MSSKRLAYTLFLLSVIGPALVPLARPIQFKRGKSRIRVASRFSEASGSGSAY